jgi:hypothetical protein
MNKSRFRKSVVGIASAVVATLSAPALADEATGKVVWVDAKNSALLLECTANGCKQIPSAAVGETFSFSIPEKLKASAAALKEGQQITVAYEQAPQGGYALIELKP